MKGNPAFRHFTIVLASDPGQIVPTVYTHPIIVWGIPEKLIGEIAYLFPAAINAAREGGTRNCRTRARQATALLHTGLGSVFEFYILGHGFGFIEVVAGSPAFRCSPEIHPRFR